jgi:poly-gamma-glutamate capsule biosynthesis protein CapA/YwtB (metallophosphatase superfamily)
MVRRTGPVACILLGSTLLAACQSNLVPAPAPVTTTPRPTSVVSDSATTVAPTTPPPPQISVVGVGDIIMGNTPDLPPGGAGGFFDAVRGQLRGDVVSGNVDAALTDRTVSSKCKPDAEDCFAFRFPPAYAAVLRAAGFGVLNLANNHSHDYGADGLADSQRAMREHGIQPTGMPGQIAVLPVRGLKVAVLGFAPYGWAQDLLDIDAARDLVRRARAQADLVVVNMHAGAEGAGMTHVRPGHETFLGEDRGDPIAFAHAVIDAGAALVIGHSPHVLRGMEWYKKRLIAYSMGNFAGFHTLSSAGVLGAGGILRVTLRADGRFVDGTLVATRMINRGYPAPDQDRAAVSLVNALSTSDFAGCGARLSGTGVLGPPTC